jgi:hypothetical protein
VQNAILLEWAGQAMTLKTKVSLITGIAVLLPMGWLGLYMWNYDYKQKPLAKPSQPVSISATLTLREVAADKVAVDIVLRNNTASRALLLDTDELEPLYKISLAVLPDVEQIPALPGTPVARKPGTDNSTRQITENDYEKSALLELLPQRAFSRTLDLGRYFELASKTRYRLTVRYCPSKWRAGMGAELNTHDVAAVLDFQTP